MTCSVSFELSVLITIAMVIDSLVGVMLLCMSLELLDSNSSRYPHGCRAAVVTMLLAIDRHGA